MTHGASSGSDGTTFDPDALRHRYAEERARRLRADGIGQFREVLPLLGSASADMQALVIAAPTIDADALQTIIANKLAGKLQVCVVLGGADALAELAAAVGSRPAPLADRQAGAIALTDLGRAARLVASPSACWVISAVA